MYKISDFSPDTDPSFFYEYFRINFLKEVIKYNAKTSVDSVRLEMISKMVIPTPKLKEQKKISCLLKSLDMEISSLDNITQKIQKQKKGLMQKLLTGKIRVKV